MPLVSLAKQQVARLQKAGMSAIYIGERGLLPSAIKQRHSHIFLSPEMVQHQLIDLLLKQSMDERKRFTHIVVDESHCVVKW